MVFKECPNIPLTCLTFIYSIGFGIDMVYTKSMYVQST